MKITFTRREVMEGFQIPTGYRIAYMDHWRGAGVAYPIGMHWIVMAGRFLWHWSYRLRSETWLDAERLAWQAKVNRSHFEGLEAGRIEGRAEWDRLTPRQMVLKAMVKEMKKHGAQAVPAMIAEFTPIVDSSK